MSEDQRRTQLQLLLEVESKIANFKEELSTYYDVWTDAKRRWEYLEGIFSGIADIKTLLPVETSRFQSISSEFLDLMKKVSNSPKVMDFLNIPGVQQDLERVADDLGEIQKALSEYLEQERTLFPRFYFVGDECLLEIIGNSKNVARLEKHFKKMFAGVRSILLNEDNTVITGIASIEGEEVCFLNPVSTVEHPKINEWLTLVEKEMRITLASSLAHAVQDSKQFKDGIDPEQYMQWVHKYPAQIVVLAARILWSEDVEAALVKMNGGAQKGPLEKVLQQVENTLNVLAENVLQDDRFLRRKKLEHLIIELVHQRTVTRRLISNGVSSNKSREWLCEMRYYFDPRQTEVLKQLVIHMDNAKFYYGFEYLGVQYTLVVQTELTDWCHLKMTRNLQCGLGNFLFGPAGIGKTLTVQALGNQLGRFVLVFNCDETFDFEAMGRIFVGLCQVGAWGFFDEFNRLEERMLWAVSQQIQTIQKALKSQKNAGGDIGSNISVELVGKQVRVNPDMAIFITMNTSYAGGHSSNLSDNLERLFQSLPMTTPDHQFIAEAMLLSQGFRTAEELAPKIVKFFKLCNEQLSNRQSDYDFGLGVLKSVLEYAGDMKHERLETMKEDTSIEAILAFTAKNLLEECFLIQSLSEMMLPMVVAEDIPLLASILKNVFRN